ncbi:unnamed protein product, partial [Amoebophrya sp. A120]|eukprot:GSA120T00012979001.1
MRAFVSSVSILLAFWPLSVHFWPLAQAAETRTRVFSDPVGLLLSRFYFSDNEGRLEPSGAATTEDGESSGAGAGENKRDRSLKEQLSDLTETATDLLGDLREKSDSNDWVRRVSATARQD